MNRLRKPKPAMTRPAHGVTEWLAAIPRRVVEVVVDHSDPMVIGKFDANGKPLPPRIEFQNRTARRAYGRVRRIATPAPALVTYVREVSR